MKSIFLIILTFLFLYSPAVAGDSEIIIMADKESYNVGDVIRLKLEVKGQDFSLGEIDAQRVAPFEVIKKEEVYDEEKDRTRFIISGRIFKTGEFTIPPFTFINNAGNKKLSSQAVVPIVSLLKEGDERLREMKPQVEVSQGGPIWPWIVIVLIIVALIALLYYFMKKKKDIVEPEEVVEQIPPHIEALEELEKIETLNLIKDGKIKELYFRVSDVIRIFKGRSSGVDAMEMTTGELIGSLRVHYGKDFTSLGRFLDNCDMVKFAKYIPPQMDVEGLIGKAIDIVKEDSPKDELQWESLNSEGNPSLEKKS